MAWWAPISSKSSRARVLAIVLSVALLTIAQASGQRSAGPGIGAEPAWSGSPVRPGADALRNSTILNPQESASIHRVRTSEHHGTDIPADTHEHDGIIEAFPDRFLRPASAASVEVRPETQGAFAAPGQPQDYPITLLNSGDEGIDTYNLTAVSAWPATFFTADGTTALGDTDSDGIVDSGQVEQGDSRIATVRVVPPASAAVGSSAAVLVTAASSNDPSKQVSVTIESAIPAWFAQAFRDDGDEAMSLYLVRPDAQTVVKVTQDLHDGGDLAIAKTASGSVYA